MYYKGVKILTFKRWRHPVGRLARAELIVVLALLTVGLSLTWLAIDSYWEDNHETSLSRGVQPSWYRSLDLAQARQVSYTNTPMTVAKALTPDGAVKRQIVSFDVPKDGLQEYGLMTEPSSKPPKQGFPVIILCHGFANPQSYSTTNAYLSDMLFYSQHGFAVIKPDYRGQGISILEGTPDGAYYSMSYNTDVLSLITAVRKTHGLNKNDINLWGHSMGAYIALRAAVLSPYIKKAVLLSGPVGSFEDMFADYNVISDMSNGQAATVKADIINTDGTPLSNPGFWEKASPINYLAYSKTDFQVHVGAADKIVPPKFSAELNSRLNELKEAHAYYVYAGATHGLVAQRPQIWQRSLAFYTTR